MKIKWALLLCFFTIATVLTGCEPLMVLDPKRAKLKHKPMILCYQLESCRLSFLCFWYFNIYVN